MGPNTAGDTAGEPRIRVLDDALADQIAAGEVVERPASIVKELIENAIDAGARRIHVEIEAGGVASVRVVDDGHGMGPTDAALCVRRHATSKLRTRQDLSAIRTLGFRGEALPSIASVSRFSLITRPREGEAAGTRIEIDGGAEPRIASIGAAVGTIVEARDLFFNLPARLKFLKSRATETGNVANVVTRAALAYPAIGFVLISDKRRMRELMPAKAFAERVSAALVGESLSAFEAEAEGIRIEAALGAPERARAGATGLHLLINGRPVRDQALARAIAFAYGSVLPPGRYPSGALHLWLDPSVVDVNVHPQKLEVRFANARATFDAVTRLVAKKLGTTAWGGLRPAQPYWQERLGLAPLQHDGAQPSAWGVAEKGPVAAGDGNDAWGLGDIVARARGEQASEQPPAAGPPTGSAPNAPPAPALLPGTAGFFGSLRVLGQAQRTLLVCEGGDALYILDQHAADERVRYDKLRRGYAERSIAVQRLLFPERVECSEQDAALVDASSAELAAIGLECSLLGPSTVAVHSVPALLANAAPARLLRDVIEELDRRGERAFSDAIDMALATMACHASIRAGDLVPREQAEQLLKNLDAVSDFAGHCPHGRPILHSVPFSDLLRKLGR
jgi:DNA mismatch repair protein MutL